MIYKNSKMCYDIRGRVGGIEMDDKYILLSFKNNFLVFSSTNNLISPSKVVNSNIIFHNIYIYTYKYFEKNKNEILNLINKVLVKNNIHSAYLEDYKLTSIVLKFIKILGINSIYFKNFKSLTPNDCNLILTNKNLTYVNTYYVPNESLNKMVDSGKKVNLNYMDYISDSFMINQDAIDSDALYFKKVLHFNEKYKYMEKDMVEFLKININLKTIHLHTYNIEMLRSIIKCLEKDNRKNVVILLYNKEGLPANVFKELKEITKNYIKDSKGDIKIIYSKNFIINNLFKQFTYNHIKLAFSIAVYVLFIGFIFSELYTYSSKLDLDRLNYEMYMSYANLTDEEGNPAVEEYDEEPQPEKKPTKSKYELDKSFDLLLSKNKDTVGWITVNNTMVNYPVVQAKDNDYYLKHDFYKKATSLGWVFMDYRNNSKDLDTNTILYGHKMKSGMMFGTLSNALKKTWYTNRENQIITFDTPNKRMKWQIVSIYRTDYTSDYLEVNFENEEKFTEWISKMIGRSVYNFKVNVKYGDKILTLSTCYGPSSANQRMAIHAVLIEED